MKLKRSDIRKIIQEEMTRKSEMQEFAESRGGAKVRQAGDKVSSASRAINELAMEQTGHMRSSLVEISEFVGKIGETLAGLGMIQEGETATDRMPTVSELKRVTRAIQKLEK